MLELLLLLLLVLLVLFGIMIELANVVELLLQLSKLFSFVLFSLVFSVSAGGIDGICNEDFLNLFTFKFGSLVLASSLS